MKYKYLLILLIVFTSCEKVFFKKEISNTPENNFNIFWNDFDKYYAQFIIKNINWDSVYNVYKPKIKPGMYDGQLFDVLSKMVNLLKDGHVDLLTPYGVASYRGLWPASYPSNQLIDPNKYVNYNNSVYNNRSIIEFGNIKNQNIGYIVIKTFESKTFGKTDTNYNVIDIILKLLNEKDGIIIDVRANGGGNSANAETIAGRFADEKRLYSKFRSKIGPGKNDFSEWFDAYIEPKGKTQFKKPVVVLTSRFTFSSAEMFVMAMKTFPNVTIVGDTTGGGVGNPVYRELPNGWVYRLSTMIGALPNLFIIEGKGIYPDNPVVTTKADSALRIDRILEKGIEVINSKI